MRKHFAKPALSRFEIRLNENIALSWEYYYKNGTLTNTYHFTHLVDSFPYKDGGCYDYYSGTTDSPVPSQGWSTTSGGAYDQWFNAQSDYTNKNSVHTMTAWLSYVSETQGAYVCFG